jgi:hypothetical protein
MRPFETVTVCDRQYFSNQSPEMNTRSVEKCISRDANIDVSRMHAPLIATNDEHLSLVKTASDKSLMSANQQTAVRRPWSDLLFQKILMGMGISVLLLVMVISAKYPDRSLLQGSSPVPFVYQNLNN